MNENEKDAVISILKNDDNIDSNAAHERRKRRKMKRQIRRFFYDNRLIVPLGVIGISIITAFLLFILMKMFSGI